MLLPLHCYDNNGLIKLPNWLYWLLIVGIKDLLLLLLALISGTQREALLSLFFPDNLHLVQQVLPALPVAIGLGALVIFLRLDDPTKQRWVIALKPTLVGAFLIQFGILCYFSGAHNWVFEPLLALSLAYSLLAIWVVMASRHIGYYVTQAFDITERVEPTPDQNTL